MRRDERIGRFAGLALALALLAGWAPGQDEPAPGSSNDSRPIDVDLDEAARQARVVAGKISEQGQAIFEASKGAEPLRPGLLPAPVASLFHDFNPGLAGLLLLASSLFRGWRMSLFLIPAALIAVMGDRLGMPSIGPLSARHASAAVAVVVGVLGLWFGRVR